MFTRQNDRPKASPGAGRFARSREVIKLWQRDEEKVQEKPTRKKHQPGGRPKADRFTRSKAAIVYPAKNENAAKGGDTALRTKWTYNQLVKAKNVTSSLLG